MAQSTLWKLFWVSQFTKQLHLGRSSPLSPLPETGNCPSWIIRRESRDHFLAWFSQYCHIFFCMKSKTKKKKKKKKKKKSLRKISHWGFFSFDSLSEKWRTAWQNWHFSFCPAKTYSLSDKCPVNLSTEIIFWQKICIQSCKYLSVLQKITVCLTAVLQK